MHRVSALDLCIRYFGKWEERENYFQTAFAYSSVYFNFSGSHVKAYALQGERQGICKIILDGEYQCSVDCGAGTEKEVCIFEKTDVQGNYVHNLVIELCPEKADGLLTVTGFEADLPVNYPKILKKEMQGEYALIQNNMKPWRRPSEWRPVERKARMPVHGVKILPGLVRKMFDLNIENLKYNAKLDWYSEGKEAGLKRFKASLLVTEEEKQRPAWAGWVPAQIEGSELGAAAGVLRWEEDPELRRVSNEIIEKICARQRKDGYFNYYAEESSYAVDCFPEECYEREVPDNYYSLYPGNDFILTERKNADRSFWTRGMVEAVNAEIPGAAQALRSMYDWFNCQEKYLPHMLLGANATNGDIGGPMIYHTPVGKPEDIITNERYYDQDYWMRAFAERQPMAMSHYPGERPHSTALLSVQAMADMYIATGDEKYRDAVLGCWDIYTRYYKHTGGMPAIIESNMPYPPGTFYLTKVAQETCGHTNWMWVNERLMQLYPDEEKYAAEIEECIYNTLINSIQPRENVYHIRLHGQKEAASNWNSCCQISAQIAVSTLPQYIYTSSDDGIYVNLFIASKFDSDFGIITTETDFPYTGKVQIGVVPKNDTDGRFVIHVRIPRWAKKNVAVCVNGTPVGEGKPGTFFALNRRWNNGDRIQLEIAFGLEAVRYKGVDQVEGNLPRYMFVYGPILMALEAKECVDDSVVPQIKMNIEDLLAMLTMDEDIPLHFKIPGTEYCLVPYWDCPKKGFTCVPVVAP